MSKSRNSKYYQEEELYEPINIGYVKTKKERRLCEKRQKQREKNIERDKAFAFTEEDK